MAVNKVQVDGVVYDIGGGGLSDDAKNALLDCFARVAWVDEDGQQYVDALQSALFDNTWSVTNTLSNCVTSNPSATVEKDGIYSATISASVGYTLTGATVSVTMNGADITASAYNNGAISIPSVTGDVVITVVAVALTVVSISAVYTQSGTVYDTDSLDSLKADLIVTATYSDSTTAVVPSTDYTLSGTLEEGTSTITVTYGGEYTTFSVTVTHKVITGWYYPFDGSLDSYGTEDFEFAGVENYADRGDGELAYWHKCTTQGDASTDPLGIKAVGLTTYPTWGNNDFTISFWYKSGTQTKGHMYAQSKYVGNTSINWNGAVLSNVTGSGWNFARDGFSTKYCGILIGYLSDQLYLRLCNGAYSAGCGIHSSVPTGFDTTAWHHYAYTRSGAMTYFFIDGSLVFTLQLSASTVIYSADQVAVGNFFQETSANKTNLNPNGYDDYMYDLYVNVGTCKWTTNFDPSSIEY